MLCALLVSVLHQNKVLHSFHKRGNHLIGERNLGLEYALTLPLLFDIYQKPPFSAFHLMIFFFFFFIYVLHNFTFTT